MVAAARASCVDDAAAIWTDVVSTDVLTAFIYQYAGDGQVDGVRDAMIYFSAYCTSGQPLPVLPSVPPCVYINDAICDAAVATNASLDARLRVLDALRLYKSPLVGGTHGCIDPFTYPQADASLNFVSCPCQTGRDCVPFKTAGADGSGPMVMAATDDTTTLFHVVVWMPPLTTLIALIGGLAGVGYVVQKLDGLWAGQARRR